jgi:dienelactone hydrolase
METTMPGPKRLLLAVGLASLLIGVSMSGLMPSAGTAQQAPLWAGLEKGVYDVGFRRVWTLDRSRVWPRSAALDSATGNVARPVRVDVWYPAHCAGRPAMKLRVYLEIAPPDPIYDDMVFLLHRWDSYSYHGLAADTSRFDRLMAASAAACWDPPMAGERFPLLVYSAGWFNRSPDNTILAEFLASHGFVVAAVPQLNPGLWTYNFQSDAASIENQLRDLEVALGRLIEAEDVDRTRIAAMGYSTGGDVALLLQGRNPLIDAIVGLDASWTIGSADDVIDSPWFGSDLNEVPILALRRSTDGGVDALSVTLDSLANAPRIIAEIAAADHGSFSDDPPQRFFLGIGEPDHVRSHAAVARSVLAFLDATLRGPEPFDGQALAEQYLRAGVDARFRPAAERQ